MIQDDKRMMLLTTEEDTNILNLSNRDTSSLISSSSKRSSVVTSFNDDDYVKYVLLFSGVMKPPNQMSLWWLCYIGWRLYIIFTVVMLFFITYGKLFQVPYTLVLWYIYPLVVALLISFTMYRRLPKLLETIEKTLVIKTNSSNSNQRHEMSISINVAESGVMNEEEDNDQRVNEEDIRTATSLSVYFISISLILGLFSVIVRLIQTQSLFISVMDFGMECSTTPVLGAVLLALSLETCLAKKEVGTIIKSAYDQTLTRQQYLKVSETIRNRSRRWSVTLGTLVLIAVWNSIALVVSLEYTIGKVNIFHHGDDDVASEIQVDVLIFIALIKESVLLFLFLFLIMGINDDADSITSILLEKEWGNIDDIENENDDGVTMTNVHERKRRNEEMKELRRCQLVLLTTTYAVKPEALKSWYSYLTFSKTKPISFTVCGLRITRSIALGMLISFLLGLMNALYKFLLYSI